MTFVYFIAISIKLHGRCFGIVDDRQMGHVNQVGHLSKTPLTLTGLEGHICPSLVKGLEGHICPSVVTSW